ncbi:Pkinase-domain-containing protein [Mycena sanguinolenta]|uniref:Pkinase-domain-containing protein n=1 Tax=Mycena sanguinolenta TaxID=230812 RepID=A0A8H6ZFA2_9AGAR|nr:Pkinase-domain-containing protein [Mycena sanguinolenta]
MDGMDDVSMVSVNENSQEHSQKTQPSSQPDEPVQKPENNVDAECWGLLIPCTPGIEPVRFLNTTPEIIVGRDPKSNVVLPWTAISSLHAIITWNGQKGGGSTVTIEDKSSNGTFLKGECIGKGTTRVLIDGCDLSFGPARSSTNPHKPEYRYTYRDLVSEKRELYKKYDLANELGKGSYARVYKALQKGTSKWVAVKVINQTMRFNLTPAREADAIREISVMRKLRHPNICAFLDYFENPNKSIDIVLEFVDGGDLGTYMMVVNNGHGIGEWMSCHFTHQICKAVIYIHSCKITHRDLKPENILLTRDQPPIVKIADFGLAKLVDDNTALRTICGTRSYMAPEIMTRLSVDSPYTNLVDSWSLGAICFTMFTMETPFPKLPTLEVKALVTNQLIDWVHLDAKEDISESGKDFVRKLLVFEPEHRINLETAQDHPWLADHKPTYEFQNPNEPDAAEALTRTASLNSGFDSSSEPHHRPVVPRAETVDPYAEDYPRSIHPAPLPDPGFSRARTADPYADDYLPVAHNLNTPLLHDRIAELAAKVPGVHLEARRNTPAQSRSSGQNPVDPDAPGYAKEDTDEILYARAPDRQPGPAAREGRAQKRTHAEMRSNGSSPLPSLSPSPPPKKTAKSKVPKKSTGPESKSDARRKVKGKQKEEPDVEMTPVVRRSTRPTRPTKR